MTFAFARRLQSLCKVRRIARLAVGAGLLCVFSANANAGGLFLTDRGVRPLGRGGAFVAGADDLQSIWYNPAGLTEAGTQILLEASYIEYDATFKRTSIPVSASTGGPGAPVTFPTVQGSNSFNAVPSIAISSDFGLKTWDFAFGVFAPYTALPEYSPTYDNGTTLPAPGPQRYSLISTKNTALVTLGIYAAKSFLDGKLSFGIGPELLIGQISTRLDLSNCPPGGVICQEQDPNYDALTQLDIGVVVAPSLSFGALYRINPTWRVGFSGHLPTWIDSGAKITVQLPNAPIFDNASVSGNHAEVKLMLPAILRLGVEARPIENLRLELAAVYEGWSINDKISILASKSNGVALHGVTGFPDPYAVGDLYMQEHFHDTVSVRVGGEYFGGTQRFGYVLRFGGSFNPSAVPDAYKSVYTIDADKLIGSLGAGLHFSGFTIDMTYAHVFALNVSVDPAKAAQTPLNPVRSSDTPATAVNGGKYTENANVVGLALGYKL